MTSARSGMYVQREIPHHVKLKLTFPYLGIYNAQLCKASRAQPTKVR
jgi:hypothetical protein